MDIQIKPLLSTCLEIEGLLCLLAQRNGSLPVDVVALIKEKVAKLSADLELVPVAEQGSLDSLFASGACECNPVESESAVAEAAEIEEAGDADVEQPESKPAAPALKIESFSDATVIEPKERPAVTERSTVPELTINDKFRFRRELFDGSDVDLKEALRIASEMTTADEVEDYFYNDLCLDPSNPTVTDFIALLTRRF